MNLGNLIQKYIENGYEEIDAIAKVCQDIILIKISKSGFKEHITIKGGVVMHNISKDKRWIGYNKLDNFNKDMLKYN